jgi:hypothetical protein
MRGLYIILSVVGWAWCLAAGALVYVRLRRMRGAATVAAYPSAADPAGRGRQGREDVSA